MGLIDFITMLGASIGSTGDGDVSITTDSTEYTIDTTVLYTIDATT